jgi:hypothetical protein
VAADRFGAEHGALARRARASGPGSSPTRRQPSTGPSEGRPGVGLGVRGDLEPVEETFDEHQRAGVLDEGVEVLTALWTGEPVTRAGRAFRLAGARMLPALLGTARA